MLTRRSTASTLDHSSASYGRHLTTAAIKAAAKYGPKIVARMARNVVKKYRSRPTNRTFTPKLRGAKTASASEIRTLKAHSESIQDGTGGQLSTHTFINNKSKLSAIEKRMIRPVEYTINGAAQIQSAVGKQLVATLQGLFHQGDISYMMSQTPLPASGSGSTTSYPTILCESFTSVVSMMNGSNANLELTIYDIISKRDASVSNSFPPDLAWNVGASLEGSSGAALVVGAVPTDSDLFNTFFKIQKRTSVVLAPGNLHRHETFSYPHRVVSKSLTSYIGSNGCIAGLTTWVMVVIKGSPDSDTVTSTQVSVGSAILNYSVQADYRFRYMLSNQPDILKSNNLPTSFTVGEQVLNPETGAAGAFTGI